MHFWYLQITKSYSALCPLGISYLTEITKCVLDETAVIAAAAMLFTETQCSFFSICCHSEMCEKTEISPFNKTLKSNPLSRGSQWTQSHTFQ